MLLPDDIFPDSPAHEASFRSPLSVNAENGDLMSEEHVCRLGTATSRLYRFCMRRLLLENRQMTD